MALRHDDPTAPSPTAVTRLDVGVAVALAVFGVIVTAWVTTHLGDGRLPLAGDAHYVWLTARSIAFDGDLDLTNQYAQFGDKWGLGRWPASDGTRFPPRELGPSLLMVPGLVLLHGLQSWAGPSAAGTGWLWSPGAEAWLATLPAAASLGPLYLALRRIVVHVLVATLPEASLARRARWIVALTLAATLGFVPPFYAVGHAGYAHAPDAVVGAWLLGALLERRPPLHVGGLLALALLMRLQNALWLLWPLAEGVVALTHREPTVTGGVNPRDAARRLATLAPLTALGLVPQAVLAWRHPGSEVGPIRWGLGFFDAEGLGADTLAVLLGVHGLWSWTPLAALATVGLLLAMRGEPPRHDAPGLAPSARRAALVVAASILLVSLVPDPDGGDAFGARRLAGLTGAFAMGLAHASASLARLAIAPAARAAWTWVIGIGVGGLVVANLVRVGLAITGVLSLRP